MKLNKNIRIYGDKVILTPYMAHHVPKYHQWMQCPILQRLTASEPLTLEEEYKMQISWLEDENKCTFLILRRETFESTNDDIEALIGDTNLFLRHDNETGEMVAEAEIMIAERSARGHGYGRESILLMLKYGLTAIPNIQRFEVKISMDNLISMRMFEKFHFIEVERAIVFNEVTLQRPITKEWIEWLNQQVKKMNTVQFEIQS